MEGNNIQVEMQNESGMIRDIHTKTESYMMGDSEKKTPPRYGQRKRGKSEKAKMAEIAAKEIERKKQDKCGNSTHTSCMLCKSNPHKTSVEDLVQCSKCNIVFHKECSELQDGSNFYCIECAKTLNWERLDEIVQVPTQAKLPRTANQIEQNRLRAISIRQKRQQERKKELDLRNQELLGQLQQLQIQCDPIQLKDFQDRLVNFDTDYNAEPKHQRKLKMVEDNHPSTREQMSPTDLTPSQLVAIDGLEEKELQTQNDVNNSIHLQEVVELEVITSDSHNVEKAEIKVDHDGVSNENSNPEENSLTVHEMETDLVDGISESLKDQHEIIDSVLPLSDEIEDYESDVSSGLHSSEDEENISLPPLVSFTNPSLIKRVQPSLDMTNGIMISTESNRCAETDTEVPGDLPKRCAPQHNIGITESLCEPHIVSPQSIPPVHESEFFSKNEETNEYHCKLCTATSKKIGGIKTHISRSHKVLKSLTYAPKVSCRKCNKEIKPAQQSEAGKCGQCKGMEHYRCSKTNKKYMKELKEGSLPFKCTRCCLPGMNVPNLDIRSTVVHTEPTNEAFIATHNNTNQPIDNADETIKNGDDLIIKKDEFQQLQEDNCVLTAKIKNLMDKEAQISMRMKLIAVDNTNLNSKVEELQKEISLLREQEVSYRNEKIQAVKQYADTQREFTALQLENEKAKEVALEVQKIMTAAIRDANLLSFEKDREIERLGKENEKLKAENRTYKELLSPDASHHRSILCQTINNAQKEEKCNAQKDARMPTHTVDDTGKVVSECEEILKINGTGDRAELS